MNSLLFKFFLTFFVIGCGNSTEKQLNLTIPADAQIESYLPYLKDKNVALLVNHSAFINGKHLLDTLLDYQIKIAKIFAPEHGFRGDADRGAHVSTTVDEATGIPIVSLFGKNKKPSAEQLNGVDVIVFDIQDVGVRFFTYISTMYYAMQAAAENNVEFIVLDRPNPLGDYVDGPVLQPEFRSFVGMFPIPVVHGLTVGELAKMIVGEKWLNTEQKLNLKVVPVANYSHKMSWSIAIKPSPNLPNDLSIRLYPSLCFFEATKVSIGRGTQFPFQVIGHPNSHYKDFSFTPVDIKGMQMNPLHENKECFGVDLRGSSLNHKFTLKYIINFYADSNNKPQFISNIKWFNLLAGNDILSKQIIDGKTEQEIRLSWQKELQEYKIIRRKYILYPDFE
ncbi:MAG: DUF1343 domain-containing protein [Bacteroidales bacterium]|nr:DUF1343 domain-containing protein [Bacteroidales bacterium]